MSYEKTLLLGRREFAKGVALAAMFAATKPVHGLWLPLGGMDVDESGWDRKRLVAALHKLNKQYADKPYIVTLIREKAINIFQVPYLTSRKKSAILL